MFSSNLDLARSKNKTPLFACFCYYSDFVQIEQPLHLSLLIWQFINTYQCYGGRQGLIAWIIIFKDTG